jgi:glucose 1-dehydrogenase
MQALGITPRQPHTARLVDLPEPALDEVPHGRGVLVQVLQVGVDGTDKELHLGEYGAAPEGYDFLVTGHESFGRVLEVGPSVTDLRPGDYVAATVRRPGGSIYDQIGTYDMTADDTYYERGINLRHGFTTERYVDDPEYLVKVPPGLKHIGVLLEPMSIVEKGIQQAYEIQRRLKVWRPQRAAVMGAGPIGLLAALVLRLRGLDVSVFARTPRPNPKADLLDAIGARYLSTKEVALEAAAKEHGPFDLIFEATGVSSIVFDAAYVLGKNGVLVLSSITGGQKTTAVQSDKLNLDFVLGNKVMFGTVNAHRGYFEQGVLDFALSEASYPGWLPRLLSHPVQGLENYAELLRILFEEKEATKAYLILAEG